jgi:hypothetical protein
MAIILCWKSRWNLGAQRRVGKVGMWSEKSKNSLVLSESEKAKIEWAKVEYKEMSMMLAYSKVTYYFDNSHLLLRQKVHA